MEKCLFVWIFLRKAKTAKTDFLRILRTPNHRFSLKSWWIPRSAFCVFCGVGPRSPELIVCAQSSLDARFQTYANRMAENFVSKAEDPHLPFFHVAQQTTTQPSLRSPRRHQPVGNLPDLVEDFKFPPLGDGVPPPSPRLPFTWVPLPHSPP